MFGLACGSKLNFERISLFPIAPLKFEMDKEVIFSTSMYLDVSFTMSALTRGPETWQWADGDPCMTKCLECSLA